MDPNLPPEEIESFFKGMNEQQLIAWIRAFCKIIRERNKKQ